MEWYRNLRIVLSTENKLPLLEQPIPTLQVPPAGQANPLDVVTTHQAWVKAQKEIARLMLMTMDPDIQRNLEHLGAYDMLKELKMLYVRQADQELLQTVREFHTCKQEEGQSVRSYVLKIKSYIDNLERLAHAMTQNLCVSLILVSLRKECDGFVQSYNMHSMGKTVTELHAMLKLHEQTLPPKEVAHALHAIRAGRILKNQKKKSHKAAKGNQGNGKAKMGYAPVQAPPFAPKPKNPPTPKKDNPAKDAICHQCGEVGHWKRNCPVYLAELTKKKKLSQGASTSVSRLYKDGFVNRFENDNLISVSKNNLIYFNAIPRDDIYEIVLSNTNDSSMYSVSNKRAKLNLDSALLWHYFLGHINKKRIEKLQHDGLLDSTDIKSFEKCVACMSGKMARKPCSHQVERAKDLLGLIHTDACGPYKIMSSQGAYYFVTFIDDFSREYTSQEFLDHLKEHGIISHRTPPYTPQHNGASERRNRTLVDMVRSMMSQTTLLKSFWDYAIESAARILNMVPTKKVDKTPYEELVDLSPDRKTVGRKWLFKKKTDMDGSIHTYKDHLVAKGFTQTPGIDYEETFSPVTEIRAIRILIAITAFYDYEIWQMDVKTAFLNGYLNEEVYMKQPEGFVSQKFPNRVCKLKRSIYGLKQASSGSYVTFLILYVDGILIMENNIPMLQDVKSYLERCFAMKDLGEAAYILGIKIYRDRSKRLISLCQSAYIEKILKRYYMENSKRETIPMQEKLKFSKSQGALTPAEIQRMQNIPYALAVGSI
nr:zinc finger, CCHC-type [Tanacetum cinerariifolium]